MYREQGREEIGAGTKLFNNKTDNPLKRHVQTTLVGNKIIEEDWNFPKADTSYLTHGIHEYPARMIPQIAKRLILRYSREAGKILDPFCGSGTTLVEARLARRYSVGVDINPLAVLLSKVKVTPIDFKKVGFDAVEFLTKLETDYIQAKRSGNLPDPPVHIYKNLLHWFKEYVARDLEFIYEKIQEIENRDVADLLKIVFSDTVFRTSNIDHRSSRFIRTLPKEKLKNHNPDVMMHFKKKLMDSIRKVEQFTRKIKEIESKWNPKQPVAVVVREDARKLPFPDNEFDSIVTSPPYGEEKNTVAYCRWAKLTLAWLRMDNKSVRQTEKHTLGASTSHSDNIDKLIKDLPSPTAKSLLKEIAKKDLPRIKDALPFFYDYSRCLKEMHRVLKPDSYCCIVIGDRSIRRKPLDMEKVTVELAQDVGFYHKKSFFRRIPQKLIPWTTPTGKTISRESIIILMKK